MLIRNGILAIVALLVCVTSLPRTQAATPTATITVSASSATQTVGTPFTVRFLLSTGGRSVSTIGVQVTHSSNLAFVSFDATQSVFNSSISDPSPTNNAFRFERWRFDGGYNGSNGEMVSVTFKPLDVGTGTISITTANTEILDAQDQTNILASVTNGSYTFKAAAPAATATPAAAKPTPKVAINNPLPSSLPTPVSSVAPAPSLSPQATIPPGDSSNVPYNIPSEESSVKGSIVGLGVGVGLLLLAIVLLISYIRTNRVDKKKV